MAAKRAGISFELYREYTRNGLKRCTKCKAWKAKLGFGVDRHRYDGLRAVCRGCTWIDGKPKKPGRKAGYRHTALTRVRLRIAQREAWARRQASNGPITPSTRGSAAKR